MSCANVGGVMHGEGGTSALEAVVGVSSSTGRRDGNGRPVAPWWSSPCGDAVSRDLVMAEVVSQLATAYAGMEKLVGSAYSLPASFAAAAQGLAVVVELLDHCCEHVWIFESSRLSRP